MTFSAQSFDDFIVHPTLNNEGPSKGGTTSTHCHFVYSPGFFLVTEEGRGDREGKGRGREGKKGEWVGEWSDRGMS